MADWLSMDLYEAQESIAAVSALVRQPSVIARRAATRAEPLARPRALRV
jgi:hypothetical protein